MHHHNANYRAILPLPFNSIQHNQYILDKDKKCDSWLERTHLTLFDSSSIKLSNGHNFDI